MAPHQQRVVDERADLQGKIERLGKFMDGDLFARLPIAEQNRLRQQSGWMCGYRAVLDERIAAFSAG